MENKKSTKKLICACGIILSIVILALCGLILYDSFVNGVEYDTDTFVTTGAMGFIGIVIFAFSIRALRKKEGEESKPVKPATAIICGILFIALLLIIGISTDTMLATLLGFFLIFISIAIIISAAINKSKKQGDTDVNTAGTGNENKGCAIVAVILIVGLIVSFLLTALVMDSVKLTGTGKPKSYAEKYGYSVEDFYYKGSDGKWYPR